MMMNDLLLVGRVARAHGNKGQVIVNPETDFPDERFVAGHEVLVELGGQRTARRIESVRFHQGRPVLGFEGIATIDAAEALAGAELKIDAAGVEPLPDGTFYRHDLVGCEVRDTRGEVIGRVTDVEGPLERSRLVVAGTRGELQIPMIDAICVTVDPAAKLIVVDPPEGLLDVNAGQRRTTEIERTVENERTSDSE